MHKSRIYWLAQLTGWLLFFTINFFYFSFSNSFSYQDALFYLLLIPSAIFLTHGFRYFILQNNWLGKSVGFQLVLGISAAFILSLALFSIQFFLNAIIFGKAERLSLADFWQSIFNFGFVFFVWGLLYFSFHYLNNFRKAEIQQLRIESTLKEAELNKLKSQLNPHFMFNAMNGIRAMVDEDPMKAKEAITQLSHILRQTLTLEKNKLISFEEEMKLVKDYLALEKMRFEERLEYDFVLAERSFAYKIPPMLLQTLVENGIKHGISKLTEGGFVLIKTKEKDNKLQIEITNSGHYNPDETPQSGFGIQNTKDRLAFVFAAGASFFIANINDKRVRTEIVIPLIN